MKNNLSAITCSTEICYLFVVIAQCLEHSAIKIVLRKICFRNERWTVTASLDTFGLSYLNWCVATENEETALCLFSFGRLHFPWCAIAVQFQELQRLLYFPEKTFILNSGTVSRGTLMQWMTHYARRGFGASNKIELRVIFCGQKLTRPFRVDAHL